MTGPKKLYAERDVIRQGQHYLNHVGAMTREGLHSKSDIAAELAHRDIEIERLTASIAELEQRAEQPLKERPDFIAGYDAGMADGKRCAERDLAEQPNPGFNPVDWKRVPAEQPKPEPVAERGWLIERSDCVWWTGIIEKSSEDYAWTRDSNSAIRFSRHKDAFPFLCKLAEQGIDCKVTEHEWIGGDLNRLYTAPPAIPEADRPDVEAVRSGRAVAISPSALEALRKRAIPEGYALDAARYRWLRNDATTHLYVRRYQDGIAEPINGEELDAAIDAAKDQS